MDVGLYAVSIKNLETIEGGRDLQFNILALVQYFENFVRAAPNNIKFPFMSILLWLRTAAAQRARKSQWQSHCSL